MAHWHIIFASEEVAKEFMKLPTDIRARFDRIVGLIESFGLRRVGMPYVRQVQGKIWEMRAPGREGSGRSLYAAVSGQRVVILRSFLKKTRKTPRKELAIALQRLKEVE